MAVTTEQLASISNALATVDQLSTSSSTLDGIPKDLEESMRYAGVELTQAAGVLLHLPQETIARAIVIFLRFYLGPEGGSFRIHNLKVRSNRKLSLAGSNSIIHPTGCLCGVTIHHSKGIG